MCVTLSWQAPSNADDRNHHGTLRHMQSACSANTVEYSIIEARAQIGSLFLKRDVHQNKITFVRYIPFSIRIYRFVMVGCGGRAGRRKCTAPGWQVPQMWSKRWVGEVVVYQRQTRRGNIQLFPLNSEVLSQPIFVRLAHC